MKLQEAVGALIERREFYLTADAYASGNVTERFASRRLARLFANGNASTLNFCKPVVEAVVNRLRIANITTDKARAQKIINRVFEINEFAVEEREFYRKASTFGDSYAIVWPDEQGDWLISNNSPLNVAIVYDPENPRKKLYAVKTWSRGGKLYLNIYGEDAIRKYSAEGTDLSEGMEWSQYDSVDNPFGVVPVFHFRTHRPFGRPEHIDAYDAQDYINKLFITNLTTIDYQGAPQRYALSNADTSLDDYEEDDIARENGNALRNGPGEVWFLNNVNSVGEFKPADPAVFWNPIHDTLESMASFTDTPLHYFRINNSFVSGEAWRTAEAPLMKKVEARQASYGATWREIMRFILASEGINTDVEIKWASHETLDELDRLDATLKKLNGGISWHQTQKENGYDSETIDRMWEEKLQEQAEMQLYERNENGTQSRVEQARVSTTNNETYQSEETND